MVFIRYLMLAITGLGGGAIVAAGVFALITSTGIMTRLAGKTHTAKYIRLYETMVILGGIWWNIFWVFSVNLKVPLFLSNIFEVVIGTSQGIFVGCLAVSLAEALNATAIFARRIKLRMGLSFIVLSVALGKATAAMIQLAKGWVK